MNAELQLLNNAEIDMNWFVQHQRNLSERYDNQYIAIEDKKVVANDSDLKELIKKLKTKKINPTETIVQFVSKIKVIF